LKCGKCDYTKNFINRTLYNTAKAQWNVLWCACCRKTYTARSWLCPCGVQWFSCNIHRAHGFNCKASSRPRDPAELVAGLADTECFPEPTRKKCRRGLGTAAAEPTTSQQNLSIELQQLQPVPTIFSDNSVATASSSVALEVSPLFATSEVFKRYQARAAKRALDTTVHTPDENDNIARQLEASSKKRRKMAKRTATGTVLPPLNHPAARLRFPHLPAQGGRVNERGAITPHTTFPHASATSRSNPYAFLPPVPHVETQSPNEG
jgi:hypothetical protein